MAKFKIGDKVKCINAFGNIEVGDIGIIDEDDNVPYVKWNDGKRRSISERRLELIEEAPIIKIDENGVSLSCNVSTVLNNITDSLCTASPTFALNKEIDELYNKIIREGEKDMKNEVLKLYYDKKREEIIDKYEKKEQEYFAKNELANKFNDLVETFEENLESLYKSVENFDNDYIVQRYDENNYKYKVNIDKISKEFEEKYIEKRNKELAKLDNEIKEISAQLSLSDDLDYQLEVLTRYGILDKKTKKMAD